LKKINFSALLKGDSEDKGGHSDLDTAGESDNFKIIFCDSTEQATKRQIRNGFQTGHGLGFYSL